MAKVLGFVGRATKAIELYHRAITILESSKGAESEDLVVPLFGLGNLLIKEGRATDAENLIIRILNIYKKLYGENDGRVGIAMCSLADVKCAEGHVDEAINLYRSAVQVFKDSKFMDLDDNVMEKTMIDLAELLHAVGRGEEGCELLKECLLITEKYKGKEHPSSVTHLINLATSYSRSKDFVEAERVLRTSLQIMMRTVGPDDQSITFPMLHLAVTLYKLNQVEEAEQLALEVVRIREKAFGTESLPVGRQRASSSYEEASRKRAEIAEEKNAQLVEEVAKIRKEMSDIKQILLAQRQQPPPWWWHSSSDSQQQQVPPNWYQQLPSDSQVFQRLPPPWWQYQQSPWFQYSQQYQSAAPPPQLAPQHQSSAAPPPQLVPK